MGQMGQASGHLTSELPVGGLINYASEFQRCLRTKQSHAVGVSKPALDLSEERLQGGPVLICHSLLCLEPDIRREDLSRESWIEG
ncbi:hypothetical protein ASE87_01265 [Frigoribacterium sp. Leaf44]|nr:hypothetical protein ASE87_01265 [Frigoribacterium sp. Leaf44]